jgi:hypothetical protein
VNQSIHTSLLIIGMFVAFAAGVYVQRNANPQPIPNQLPSNFEPTACIVGEKAARSEAAAYQALLTKALEMPCKPTQDAH